MLVVALLVFFSWQYSATPLRFKEKPAFDSLSNGVIVDLVYLAGYTAGGGRLDRKVFELKGHILGLCTAGVHALGAVVMWMLTRTLDNALSPLHSVLGSH